MEANLKFHHKGKFEKNGYVGGEETSVMGVDLDMFSYTVLMEYVRDELEYTEIGGVYSWKGPMSGWKLVTNDADLCELMQIKNNGDYIDFYVDTVVDDKIEPMKQMQPHVIVRPRKNLLTPGIKISSHLYYFAEFVFHFATFSVHKFFVHFCLNIRTCLIFSALSRIIKELEY